MNKDALITLALSVGVGWSAYWRQAHTGVEGWILRDDTYRYIPWLRAYFTELGRLVGVDAWQILWLHTVVGWWVALYLFHRYLQALGYDTVFASVLPLLTIGGLGMAYTNLDALLFLMVLVVAKAAVEHPKWLLATIPVGLVLAATYTYLPAPESVLRLHNLKYFLFSFQLWLPLTLTGLLCRRLPHRKRLALLVPLFVVVFAVGGDWYRWIVHLGVLWVPGVLAYYYGAPRRPIDPAQEVAPRRTVHRLMCALWLQGYVSDAVYRRWRASRR